MNQIGVPASYVVGTGNETDQSTSPTNANGGAALVLGVGARFDVADNLGFIMQASESIGARRAATSR